MTERLKEICLVCGRKMNEDEKEDSKAFQIKLDDGGTILHSGHDNCVKSLYELIARLNYDRIKQEPESDKDGNEIVDAEIVE